MPKTVAGHGSDPKPPSPKVRRAIEALLHGEAKTQREAAEIAGMNRQALCTALKRPLTAQYVQQQIKQRISTVGALKAAGSLEHLSVNAESEAVRADVSKHLLAIGGVKPTADRRPGESSGIVVNINLSSLSGAEGVHMRDVTPQVIEITGEEQ